MNLGFITIDPAIANGPVIAMLVVDFIIVFTLLVLVRTLYSAVSGLSMIEEVADKDNFALGISLAGATAGVAIMLTGVVSGDFAAKIGTEIFLVLVYGVVGLILMWLTRIIFDRISLPGLSVRDEVKQGNIPVAVVEAGNLIATAIMVRAVLQWVDDSLVRALIAVLLGYVASQIILALTAYYRIGLYKRRNDGDRFDEAIQGGNLALAMRFVGFQAGVALAVTAASGLVPYRTGAAVHLQALGWGVASLAMAVVLIVFAALAERYVLRNIDVSDEVDGQRNIGVATLEIAVYVAIGLLLTAHLT